jgi:hypothetical protein
MLQRTQTVAIGPTVRYLLQCILAFLLKLCLKLSWALCLHLVVYLEPGFNMTAFSLIICFFLKKHIKNANDSILTQCSRTLTM